MLGQNCLFCTVIWLLFCFLAYSVSAIIVFGSDSSKPEINCGPKDMTPNIVSSKHHHFNAPLNKPFIYSFLKHTPLNLAYLSRCCIQATYSCSTKLSSSLLLPAPHSLFFVLWERTAVASKLVQSSKEASFRQLSFREETNTVLMLKQGGKKKPFCCNFTNKYREYSYRNTKDQGVERGEIFLIALALNNIGSVQKYNLWSWSNNPK